MAAVLPVTGEPRGGEGEPSATGPPPGAALPPTPSGGPEPLDPVVAGDGPRFRFGPAMLLDRRAVVGLTVLLLFAVGYAVQHFWLARPQAVAVPALASASSVSSAPASSEGGTEAGALAPAPGPAAEPVVVDIGGRVHVPGVHTLPGGSRVADALRAAGGPLSETDTRSLNLARVLTDGEQILVGESGNAPASADGTGTGVPPAHTVPKRTVSLNRATLEQLDSLPGVGPTLAQRILAYRTSHGSFRTLDQLRQVSGIGARTYAELRPLLTL
ncbi:ComEA family DNA-binding protein [Streptomyces kaniharaensis]|uniref:ComEA family DNA-binding protein n=2 Tax=Streptomyces kaniharaensis TaxID=212423 RepID=A0A6N7KN71_9ACTN|nr:ComEA family DNA-binding protein [Streptomyces kaniharaensis]